MQRITGPLTALVAGAILLAGAACSSNEGGGNARDDDTASPAASTTTAPAGDPTTTLSTSNEMPVAELVEKAEPAIVRIETGSGVGTGFVVDADGYIITNNHVIEGPTGGVSSSIMVTLSDGTELSASVVGRDTRTDLALIQVDQGGLTPLPLGELSETVVGQDVVAIGYALDLRLGEGPSFSVTRGIISAKNRAIEESQALIFGSIQTDAAINHGNSGGPLLNLSGEVVGVNTAIAPDGSGGVAVGIGFAVGVDTVEAVYEELLDDGRVNRGFLGIGGFESLQPAQARERGLDEGTGGIIAGEITAGGPADAAGFQPGDIVTKIAETEIRTEADLAVALILNGAGESVTVEFYRGDEAMSAEVTLGTPPNS